MAAVRMPTPALHPGVRVCRPARLHPLAGVGGNGGNGNLWRGGDLSALVHSDPTTTTTNVDHSFDHSFHCEMRHYSHLPIWSLAIPGSAAKSPISLSMGGLIGFYQPYTDSRH